MITNLNIVISIIIALIAVAIFVGGIAWWDWETTPEKEE